MIELFTPQTTGFQRLLGFFIDPCSGPSPIATPEQCARTGFDPSIPPHPAIGPPNIVTGGNPNLQPESADIYKVGVNITPNTVPGLSISAEYFDISVDDVVGRVPPQVILDQCIQTGQPRFCSLINRDDDNSLGPNVFDSEGGRVGLYAINTNIARLETRGVDVNASYEFDIGAWGGVDIGYDASILFELSTDEIPDVSFIVDCKGFYAGECGTPSPAFRHRMLTTWRSPWNVDVTAVWRRYGGAGFDNGTPTSVSTGGAFLPSGNVLDDRLDAANYLDLAALLRLHENASLRAGVRNVLGRDPGLTTGAGLQGNTYPNIYDPAGRFIFFGLTLTN